MARSISGEDPDPLLPALTRSDSSTALVGQISIVTQMAQRLFIMPTHLLESPCIDSLWCLLRPERQCLWEGRMLETGLYVSNPPDGEEAQSRGLTVAQQLHLLSALEKELANFLQGELRNNSE
jgi:hypothetical protein